MALNIFKNEDNTIRFEVGETIFADGDEGGEMFAVKEGEVEISYQGRTLEVVTAGGIFGEMALVDESARSADATARTDCELVPIDEEGFKKLVRHNPFFALHVLRVAANRLRRETR